MSAGAGLGQLRGVGNLLRQGMLEGEGPPVELTFFADKFGVKQRSYRFLQRRRAQGRHLLQNSSINLLADHRHRLQERLVTSGKAVEIVSSIIETRPEIRSVTAAPPPL